MLELLLLLRLHRQVLHRNGRRHRARRRRLLINHAGPGCRRHLHRFLYVQHHLRRRRLRHRLLIIRLLLKNEILLGRSLRQHHRRLRNGHILLLRLLLQLRHLNLLLLLRSNESRRRRGGGGRGRDERLARGDLLRVGLRRLLLRMHAVLQIIQTDLELFERVDHLGAAHHGLLFIRGLLLQRGDADFLFVRFIGFEVLRGGLDRSRALAQRFDLRRFLLGRGFGVAAEIFVLWEI